MNPRTVLVISPQSWAHIPISKHNYAIALARRGCQVVFLNPPVAGLQKSPVLEDAAGYPGLRILSYRPRWFARLRFHLPAAFDWLMARHVRQMLRTHRIVPDIVWCFDFNLYHDLSLFGAAKRIFHPVDPLSNPRHIKPSVSADLVLTVSCRIAGQLAPARRPVHVINHGLAPPFEQLAKARRTELLQLGWSSTSEYAVAERRAQVGYAGNLGRQPMNREVLCQIILQNPQADFHFWGPTDAESDNVAAFVVFLRSQCNVTLYGAVSQAHLASDYSGMDVFLLSYVADPRESDRSNSHKILEYLSSGRVVVSSHIQAYENTQDLLVMSESDTDADLPRRFSETLSRLTELNRVQLQLARIAFALDNTYDRQIERIFQLLDAVNT